RRRSARPQPGDPVRPCPHPSSVLAVSAPAMSKCVWFPAVVLAAVAIGNAGCGKTSQPMTGDEPDAAVAPGPDAQTGCTPGLAGAACVLALYDQAQGCDP